MKLYLVRHAASYTNAGLHWGDGPASIPLTAEGQLQACDFAEKWAVRPDLIVVSPYVRSRQSATPLAEKFSLPLITMSVQEFTYWDFRYTKTEAQGDRKIKVDRFWSRLDPMEKQGGEHAESFVELIVRCKAFRLWATQTSYETCVCFSHGFFMHAFRAMMSAIDLPPKEMMAYLHATLPGRGYANLEVAEFLLLPGNRHA